MDVGKVKVSTGSKGAVDGERILGGTTLTAQNAVRLAALIEQGNDTRAVEDLERIVLERYGERFGQSMSFMQIADLCDAVTWR